MKKNDYFLQNWIPVENTHKFFSSCLSWLHKSHWCWKMDLLWEAEVKCNYIEDGLQYVKCNLLNNVLPFWCDLWFKRILYYQLMAQRQNFTASMLQWANGSFEWYTERENCFFWAKIWRVAQPCQSSCCKSDKVNKQS